MTDSERGSSGGRARRRNEDSSCADCNADSFLWFDLFAKKPELRLPTGKRQYSTFVGCLCSILYLAAIVVLFIFYFREFGDEDYRRYTVSKTELRDAYSAIEPYGSMKLAFALIDDADPTAKLQPEIGSLKAYHRTWDLTDSSLAMAKYTEIGSGPCTYIELGLKPPSDTTTATTDNEPKSSDGADDANK